MLLESKQMRYLVVALLAATTLGVGAAAASDLPVRQAPAPMYSPTPVYNWTGFYVGGHIGGAWSNADISDPTGVNFAPAGVAIGNNGNGFLGGAQIGYNWQTGNWVFGIQGDMSWTSIDASVINPFITTMTFNDKTDWLATVTGRIGYAWNNVLWYGKGGGAWVHNNISGTDPTVPFNFTGSDTRGGWTFGTGLEYGFTPNWTAFIEYDYIGLGTRTITLTDPVFGNIQADVQQNIQIVKGGINYKFGSY
jgi:outer membrane immunogenic protein